MGFKRFPDSLVNRGVGSDVGQGRIDFAVDESTGLVDAFAGISLAVDEDEIRRRETKAMAVVPAMDDVSDDEVGTAKKAVCIFDVPFREKGSNP